jgi:hypothetical protein
MHTHEYQSLSRESRQIGDEFYECMSAWLKDPWDPKVRHSCLENGLRYEEALVRQIAYLKSAKESEQRSVALETCETYYAALESQLQLLTSLSDKNN